MAIGGFGAISGAVVTSAVDTSAATEIAFTASLASAGDAMRLESYLVEVFPSV